MSGGFHGLEAVEVQHRASGLLRDTLGYESASGPDLDAERGSDAEVILVRRLSRKLKQINPGLSDAGVKQAIEAIEPLGAPGLLEANEKVHRLLSRWVTVQEEVGRQVAGRSVRYIDYDCPDNNEFLVATELRIKGVRFTRRLDLVIFVNGIPVVVIECKEPGDPHGIEIAIDDLNAYQDPVKGVHKLFHSVHFCMAVKKMDARYGTIGTPLSRYAEWKHCYPMTTSELGRRLGRDPTPQDVMLCGLLAKENLLDHIRTFVAFDREGGMTVKKLARYQQFEAVNRTVERIIKSGPSVPNRERGGVIWHTQGSGKSLTMLWLAIKLRRLPQLQNPTLLIITDRQDLDRQITQTFQSCGFENPIQARRISHLRRLLSGPAGQTVMTTVQKFQDEVDMTKGSTHPVLSTADNVFALVDEAHRSEYGRFNAHLRKALPNACMLAFTGTPIPKTLMKFGNYIHKYTMPQSVADHATVPILYEARLPELAVWGKRLDPIFNDQFGHLTAEQRRTLQQQEITEKRVAAVPDRVEMIAKDIADHYRANFEADGFKGQVVASSQEAAARYYREINRYLPDRVALLISDPSRKNSDLNELTEKFANEEQIIGQFKYESVQKLAIIVVVDKYLTGFDAPIERVLYLDRSLKEHNLLQAVARVNRPMPEKDKQWGLIVDYWGVSKFLDQALQGFDDDLKVAEVLSRRDDDRVYEDLKHRRAEVLGCFPTGLNRQNIEPWLLALEQEDAQARFLAKYRAFYRTLEQLLPDPRGLNFLGDFAWLRRVRREMVTHYSLEDLEVADCSEKVKELINKHIKGEEVTVLLKPVSILSDQFKAEVEKLQSPRAKASRMEHAISKTITVKLAEDPAYYESVRERLERIINDRRQERIDDVREYELLMRLRHDLAKGPAETAETLGMTETAFAYFGLLNRELEQSLSGNGTNREATRVLAEQVVNTLEREAVIDWTRKEDVQREMRRKVKRELRLAGWPDEGLEAATSAAMDLARARLAQ